MNKEFRHGASCIPANELQGYFARSQKWWDRLSYGPKAQVERYLVSGAGYFPDALVIPRVIISADDTDAIETVLTDGIKENRCMGVRSIADRPVFFGAKLPWVMGVDSVDKVKKFLHTTLPAWHKNASSIYQINEVILMGNPPEIGTKEDLPNQFVTRVSWDNFSSKNGLESSLLVEMTIGTHGLRVMDQRMAEGDDQMIRFELIFRPTGFLDRKEIRIGSAYADNPQDVETASCVLHAVEKLIKDPTVQLLRRMDFFAGIGLHIVEFQGYVNELTGERNMFIYGLRGTKDDTMTGLHPSPEQ